MAAERKERSSKERFWEHSSFAVIGDPSSRRPFPRFTYRGLRAMGKTVYAVNPAAEQVEGDTTYPSLSSLPGPVEAAVLEVAKAETAAWVERVAQAGIQDLWIHDGTQTPEALALASEKGLRVETGACAAMYVTPGPSIHGLHRWFVKLSGRF